MHHRMDELPENSSNEAKKRDFREDLNRKVQKLLKKFSKSSCFFFEIRVYSFLVGGLSPSGKATDSDSVIPKVQILLAQFYKALMEKSMRAFLRNQFFDKIFCVALPWDLMYN